MWVDGYNLRDISNCIWRAHIKRFSASFMLSSYIIYAELILASYMYLKLAQ